MALCLDLLQLDAVDSHALELRVSDGVEGWRVTDGAAACTWNSTNSDGFLQRSRSMSTYGAFIPPVISTWAAGGGAGALTLFCRGAGAASLSEEESTARRLEDECLEEDEERLDEGGVGVADFFFFFGERAKDVSRGAGGGLTEAARRSGLPHSSIGDWS